MDYREARRKCFATGTVPDGYFGDRKRVEFALVGNDILIIHNGGYYTGPFSPVVDVREALWQMRHGPHKGHVKSLVVRTHNP